MGSWKLKEGILEEGEKPVVWGQDQNGRWVCVRKEDKTRIVRITEEERILDYPRPFWYYDLPEKTPEQYEKERQELRAWADLVGRRWEAVRKALGESVKWGDPGFFEIYGSIESDKSI